MKSISWRVYKTLNVNVIKQTVVKVGHLEVD